MKNIKFIPLFLIALSLIVSSCAIDDDDAVIPSGSFITASLDKSGEIFVFAGNDIVVDIILSSPIGIVSQYTYTLNGVEQTIQIPANGSSVSITLPNVVGATNAVVLKDGHLLNNDSLVLGSNTSVTFIGVPAVNPNGLEVLMDWSNSTENDWDLWVTDEPPTVGIVTSQSVTPIEAVTVLNTVADGTYNILPRDWASVDAVVDVAITLVHPDGTIEQFSESIESGNDFVYFIKFDKVGSTYTTTQVPAVPVF